MSKMKVEVKRPYIFIKCMDHINKRSPHQTQANVLKAEQSGAPDDAVCWDEVKSKWIAFPDLDEAIKQQLFSVAVRRFGQTAVEVVD